MTVSGNFRNHFMSSFETRSALLVAALVVAGASAAHAQTAAPAAASPGSPPSQMSPAGPAGASGATGAAGSIPQNKASNKDVDAAFDRADANKDGKLDRKEAEIMPAVAQRFDQLDTNRDGFVSREEFSKITGS